MTLAEREQMARDCDQMLNDFENDAPLMGHFPDLAESILRVVTDFHDLYPSETSARILARAARLKASLAIAKASEK